MDDTTTGKPFGENYRDKTESGIPIYQDISG